MYAVVGCSECSALWVVEGEPETTRCRRCGRTHRYAALKRFVTTEDGDHARRVRASMLAERQDHGEAFADVDAGPGADDALAADVVPDEEYLAAAGLDPEEVAAAGDRAAEGAGGAGDGAGRQETVRAALRDLDGPTAGDVVAYAGDRGVDAEDARRVLDRLVRAGEATERDGIYRLL